MPPSLGNLLKQQQLGDLAQTKRAGLHDVAFAGTGAGTADKASLSRAIEMQVEGVEPETIWGETGWFYGGDQKWRWEIPDAGAKLKTSGRAKLNAGAPLRLDEILEHPAIFEAYPQFRDIIVKQEQRTTATGSYNKGVLSLRDTGDLSTMSTMLHELQHAVQGEEGFAPGGNAISLNMRDFRKWEKQLNQLDERIARLSQTKSGRNSPELAVARAAFIKALNTKIPERPLVDRLDFYIRLAGEVEARNVGSRFLGGTKFNKFFPPTTADVPLFAQEILP